MDISLHYQKYGQGEPLILLHGNGEDSSYFQYQLAAFSACYQVITVDTRGHGCSPRGTAPFTLDQFAEDIHDFLLERDIQRCNLLGFSDGGNIALLFALKYPQMINKLILNGANLFPSGVKLRFQLPVVLGYGIASLFSLWDKKALPKKEMLSLMVTQPHIDLKQLQALDIPTLVVVGDQDMIKESHTRLIAQALPQGCLRILPGDHFLAAGNSDCFNKEILSFLRD